jgi:hypothetical protein
MCLTASAHHQHPPRHIRSSSPVLMCGNVHTMSVLNEIVFPCAAGAVAASSERGKQQDLVVRGKHQSGYTSDQALTPYML